MHKCPQRGDIPRIQWNTRKRSCLVNRQTNWQHRYVNSTLSIFFLALARPLTPLPPAGLHGVVQGASHDKQRSTQKLLFIKTDKKGTELEMQNKFCLNFILETFFMALYYSFGSDMRCYNRNLLLYCYVLFVILFLFSS